MKKKLQFRLWGRVFILPTRVKWLIIIPVILAVAGTGFVIQKDRGRPTEVLTLSTPMSTPEETQIAETPSPVPAIWVYVVGEVEQPGVYALSSGAMVSEAIEAAGGFTEQGDAEAINLVAVLGENTMIKIPAKGERTEDSTWLISGSVSGQAAQSAGKININTASQEGLCTLSGIGENTAKKIINYRESNGPFKTIEDIMKVPGIKESKFEAIKEDICVG